MINYVEVNSKRNAKMLRAWHRYQKRNGFSPNLLSFITVSILVIAVITIAITFIVRGL